MRALPAGQAAFRSVRPRALCAAAVPCALRPCTRTTAPRCPPVPTAALRASPWLSGCLEACSGLTGGVGAACVWGRLSRPSRACSPGTVPCPPPPFIMGAARRSAAAACTPSPPASAQPSLRPASRAASRSPRAGGVRPGIPSYYPVIPSDLRIFTLTRSLGARSSRHVRFVPRSFR